MFHGLAWRNGRSSPSPIEDIYYRDSISPHPLWIVRNGLIVPEITMPARNLVVSEKLKQILANAGAVFLRVLYLRLFSYTFAAGDFSYESDPMWLKALEVSHKDVDWFYFAQPDDRDLHESIGDHYEVLLASPDERANSTTSRAFPLSLAFARAEVSPQILTQFPLISAPPGFVASEAVFESIRQYLDPDYFALQTVEIGFDSSERAPPTIRIIWTSE